MMEANVVNQAMVNLPKPRSDQAAKLFVWGTWLVMMIANLFILADAGRVFPLNEDWWLVPPLTGNEPNLAAWFWIQNSEHRIPFPRLILMALLKISHGDLRSGMLFNIIGLAAVAWAMIWVARQLRGGRTTIADAFFPIALLHQGNAENLFWCWQLTQVVPTVMTCIVLLVLVSDQTLRSPGTALVGGISLMLLPLSGSHALLFAPSLALWFGYLGFLRWRIVNEGSRWTGGFLIGSATVAILLTALHFATYERPSWRPPDPTIAAALETAIKFLALGFGPAVRSSWVLPVVAIIGLLTASAAILGLGFLHYKGQERYRTVGMFIFFGNIILLALATGWGRATAIESVYGQYPLRYVTMAVPALFIVFFIWELYGPRSIRSVVQIGLLLAMCFLIPSNTLQGLSWLYWFPERDKALEQDLAAGVPASILAERYRGVLLHWVEPEQIADYMRMLREAGIGPFAQLAEDPIIPTDAGPGQASLQVHPQAEIDPALASLVTQEIRYYIPDGRQVYLIWGMNGWLLAPEELRPAGTKLKDNVMHTQMKQEGDTFIVKIQVPTGTTVDYGFLITKREGILNRLWPASPTWDWNNDQGYQMIVLKDDVVEVKAPLTLVKYLFSIDFGRYLFFAIGLILGLASLIPHLHKLPGYRKEAIRSWG